MRVRAIRASRSELVIAMLVRSRLIAVAYA
jgi:hypothetical protein